MTKLVIMGASSGIGLKVAETYAARGFKLGLAARRIEALAALKCKYPNQIEYEAIDINSSDAPDKLFSLIDRLGGMDIYFHNSGIGYDNPTLDSKREADIISTNSVGFARMISAAYNYFKNRGINGRIAAVTSVAGTTGIGSIAAYSTSKNAAQTYLTAIRQLANIEHSKIKISDIRPGWIRTDLLHNEQKYPMEMSLDYAVKRIVNAIDNAPKVAYIDWKWGLLVKLWKLIPTTIWTRLKIKV